MFEKGVSWLSAGQESIARVTVVTLTRDRLDRLREAMRSVANQRDVDVEHIVVGDRCPALADDSVRDVLEDEFPTATVRRVSEESHPELPMYYKPARLAYLRNLGASLGSGSYIAQLDDDNTYQSTHLRSLVDVLQRTPEAGVAYSWRRLFDTNGAPYPLFSEDPWHPDISRRVASFRRLAGMGVFESGTNLVRDTFVHEGRLVARVDTSELLMRREIVRQVPFPEHFSAARQRIGLTEDMAFVHALYKKGVQVLSSGLATVNYTMGGYSNVTEEETVLRA